MTVSMGRFTHEEEIANAVSHLIGVFLSIAALVLMIVFSAIKGTSWHIVSSAIFGTTLILLYLSSTFTHWLKPGKLKEFFFIIDQIAIFFLIAGTYTPMLLISIGGTTGWIFFGIQWGMASLGIVLKLFYTGRFKFISTLIYAFMGWIIVFRIDVLLTAIPTPAYWLLISGGLAYTVGIVFYALDSRIKYAHFIWHLFVMAGSILHYIMIIKYVIN